QTGKSTSRGRAKSTTTRKTRGGRSKKQDAAAEVVAEQTLSDESASDDNEFDSSFDDDTTTGSQVADNAIETVNATSRAVGDEIAGEAHDSSDNSAAGNP